MISPTIATSNYIRNMMPSELAVLRNKSQVLKADVLVEIEKSISAKVEAAPYFCDASYQAGKRAFMSGKSIVSFDGNENTFSHSLWLQGFIDAEYSYQNRDCA